MAEQLEVELREGTGKWNSRRLRRAGKVPAVLYGHKQESLPLAVPADQLDAVIRHGSRLVDLRGAVRQSALIRELQWDTWGTHVLHVDLARVSAEELVEVRVAVELRGEAPGVKLGGMIEQLMHEVNIQCPAAAVPDKLELSINELTLGGQITIGQLPLPAGARVLGDPDAIVVQCVEVTAPPEEEELAAEVTAAEPEVIRERKKEEEEE